jgi:serine protease
MNHFVKMASVLLLATALAACSGVGSSLPNVNQPVHSSASASHGGGDLSNVHLMPTMNNIQPNLTGALTYHNGPVLKRPIVYIVFWGFGNSGYDPSGEQTYETNFMTGLGGTPWHQTDHQYYQIVSGLTQHIANEVGELKGTWVDMTNAVPSSPTDFQIQAEAGQLMAHFAFNKNASYIVATPHGHNTQGFGSSFCAYHGATTQGGHVISYTNLPYITDAGRSCGENSVNGGNAGLLDGVSIVSGHEYAESETDPQLNAWWDNANGEENGDLCAWRGLGDITESTGTFAMQPIWSDTKNACELHTP